MEAIGFIYITTNMLNGKKYIGQRVFSKGWKSYLGSGTALLNAVKKYGRENFSREIVAIAKSFEELNDLEQTFIRNHNATISDDYYNIAEGGLNGSPFLGKTKEEINIIKQKISMARTGKNYGFIGEKAPMYGKHHSEKTKESIRNSMMGVKNHFYGKHHSEESILKLKNTQEKLGISKKVSQYTQDGDLIGVYSSIREASRETGVDRVGISWCVNGKQKTAGKYIWKYC